MLKKIITSSIIISFILAPYTFSPGNINLTEAATIISSNSITQDTIWTSEGSPYFISGTIIIPEGITLTIEPGVIVKFRQSSLIVNGTLNASGEENNPVVFTSINNDFRGGQTVPWSSGNPAPGDWGALKTGDNGKINLNYAIISYGGQDTIYQANNGSIIKQNTANAQFVSAIGAITAFGGEIIIKNSEIKNNLIAVLAAFSPKISISASKIYNNIEDGVIGYDLEYQINAANNWWGDDSGPYNQILNPEGKGDSVSDNVLFDPWIGQNKKQTLDPVIIVPGIMGSWNVGGKWELDPILNTYDNLWEALKLAGYEEGKTLFAFPYQWRLPNSYNASLLKEKIDDVKEICDCDKVDIVAHSMGGLVARSYIEGSSYQDDIDQLIFLAVPHRGSTKAYLMWEGGNLGPKRIDKLQQKIFTLEAIKNGYIDIYNYVRKFPVQSVQELLPIYNYLRDKDTMKLRAYPDNYPVNIFLELLNNPNQLDNLNSVNITNILADAGASSTINNLRVVDNWIPLDSRWEYGKPEDYNMPFTDHGLEYGAGDTTVPERSNKDFMGLDNIIIKSTHNDIVTDAQKRVIKELTGVEPTEEVRMNIFKKFLLVRIFSPADFAVVAPDGKKTGKDFASRQAVNEIKNAFYSGFDSGIEFAVIPNPSDGEYQIELEGTGDGEYRLSASFIDDELGIDKDFTGNIKIGQNQEFDLVYDSEEEEPISDLEPVDNTPPVITVNSPISNKQYLHNEILNIDYGITDDFSGVASSTIILNSRILATTAVDLFDYGIGVNTLSIAAIDNAGNQSELSVNFEITADIGSTIADIETIYQRGWIAKKYDKKILIKQLKHLERQLEYANGEIKIIKKIENNKNINRQIKRKILNWFNKRSTIIIKYRQRTINKQLNLLEKTLNRIKRKNRINKQGYDIIISDINYLRNNL